MQRDDKYLLDILIAARKILKFVEGVDFAGFQENEVLQYALIRLFEILGEAARSISEEYKNNHPEIPWVQIIGMRNRLIHEYFRVNIETVWNTTKKDLPGLIAIVEPLITKEDSSS
jgi:uncharacterized protein with HEPN domain